MRSVFEPPRSGGADYALIDFSTNSLASAFIADHRMPFIDSHPEPQIGETVCRTGVSSGQQCGQIAASQGEDQYLTTGMRPSIPGDSGGPAGRRPPTDSRKSSGSGWAKKRPQPARSMAALPPYRAVFAPSTHPAALVRTPAAPSSRRSDRTHRTPVPAGASDR